MYRCYTGLSLLILICNIYLGLIGLLRTLSVSHGRITTLLSFGKWQVGRSAG